MNALIEGLKALRLHGMADLDEHDTSEATQDDIKAPLYDEDLVDENGICDLEDVEEIKDQIRENMRTRFKALKADGMGATTIAREMGITRQSVYRLLKGVRKHPA